MKTVGIICEYNPFHNGHAKQLRSIEGNKVCLMSGNFVQRGEPAIFDKYTRAKAAVLCGADLVLELPLTYAIRSAEGFADGGVELLSRMGCVDALSFGSECGSVLDIMSTTRLLLSDDFPEALRKELAAGCSFPAARQRAVTALGGNGALLSQPNNILAVEYCKAILKYGNKLAPLTITRDGSYHESCDPQNPSATTLRSTDAWSGFIPEAALSVFQDAPRYSIAAGERAWLGRLRSMTETEFEALPYGSEGLWRKVFHACRSEATLEGILAAAKSKRYTHTRLMRLLLCALLGISGEMLNKPAPYVRILAANETGLQILRQIKQHGELTLINAGETPPDQDYFALERRASDLYGLFCSSELPPIGAEKSARIFLHRS